MGMKKYFPKVGMRMVKSCLAVFVCLLLSSLLFKGTSGFYVAIAAVLCIQPDVHGSIRIGMNRLFGTVVGALYGLLTMLLVNQFPDMLPLLRMALFSLVVLLCIYTNVVVKSPDSSYITCVIFLSIVLASYARADLLQYVTSRFLETALGVLVAIVINLIPLGRAQSEDESPIE